MAEKSVPPPDYPPPNHAPPNEFSPPPGPPPTHGNVNDAHASDKSQPIRRMTVSSIPDSQLSALKGYDIVYLVDDSSSMAWKEKQSNIVPWPAARDALASFSSLCSEWDEDGQDLWFINRTEYYKGCSPQRIIDVFDSVSPRGATNMGRKLQQIAHEYFQNYDPVGTKPLNIIAITDGEFTDDVATVVRWIVQQLERFNAFPNSFGIQFVQIGADKRATKHLQNLDDKLGDLSRDIVDTVPWREDMVDGRNFDGKYLLKAVLGAINKDLDDNNIGRRNQSGNQTAPVHVRSKPAKPSRLKRLFGKS